VAGKVAVVGLVELREDHGARLGRVRVGVGVRVRVRVRIGIRVKVRVRVRVRVREDGARRHVDSHCKSLCGEDEHDEALLEAPGMHMHMHTYAYAYAYDMMGGRVSHIGMMRRCWEHLGSEQWGEWGVGRWWGGGGEVVGRGWGGCSR